MRVHGRCLIAIGVLGAMIAAGPATAAAPKKCSKGKIARVVSGKRTCVPAARYQLRARPTSVGTSALRDLLTGRPLELRRKGRRPIPRIIPRATVSQLLARFPVLESDLKTKVRAALTPRSLQSHGLIEGPTTVSTNSDGSVSGRTTLTVTEGVQSAEVGIGLTGRTDGSLDLTVDVTADTGKGSRLTKGMTFRDLFGNKDPECPKEDGVVEGKGGVNGTSRSEERFGGKNVNLGTVREGTTVTVKSTGRTSVGADGRLGPVTVNVTASFDYSRSAQGLAFLSSRARATGSGTMTATIDPATGKISNGKMETKVKSTERDAAGEAAIRDVIEKLMREEAERLRDKFVDVAKKCGSYDVALNLTTNAVFATHNSTGTIAGNLAPSGPSSAGPFTASTPISYTGVSFVSKLPECSYVNPISNPFTWTVTITRAPNDRIHVEWTAAATGPSVTATVMCDMGSIPGQPGPSLILPTPAAFDLPSDGGQVAIGGGFQSGGDGFTHTGTMTVTRRAK